jgi:tryptophan synthase alpha chain
MSMLIFFTDKFNMLDTILLTTPTSGDDRTIAIEKQSRGFLYYVSMTETTGCKLDFNKYLIEPLKHTASLVKHNPLLVGSSISSSEEVKIFMPYCSGVIVGSAVIRMLINDNNKFSNTLKLKMDLKSATYNIEVRN